MKTLIWIAFGIYVIFANAVFKRVRSEHVYYQDIASKILHGLIVAVFEAVFVVLPGYLLHKFLQ
jgi:hypothetical protein